MSWDSNPYVTNSTPTTITMNQDVALVANVERIYVLTLDINIPGAGSLSGAGQYLPSEDAGIETITAVEAGKVEGYVFERWEVISGSIQSGANLNNNSTTVRILEDTLIRAIYSVKEYVIKVTSEPDEGTVGINGGTKSTSVTESFNITETITLQNLAQTTSTHSHQFRRYIVVSADQGLTPGAVFNPGNGFNLSEYGNVELKAEFLKTFTLNTRVYLDGVKSTDTTETLVESSYNSNEANKDVSWPSVTGYVIDRAVKGSGNTFDVNNYSDQNITITQNSYIYFYLDTADVLTLTIRKRVDGGSPTTVQTLTYDEINNTATVPAITIPSDEEFISWEITAGTTPTSFSNLSKTTWPQFSQFDMVDNVILTYDVGNVYTFDIQLYIPGEGYDNAAWGTPVGEGSYSYGATVNFGVNLANGYEFDYWYQVTWPQGETYPIDSFQNFQSFVLKGHTVLRAYLKRIPFPIDGEGTVLPPSMYDTYNYGHGIDRNEIAMSKDGQGVVLSSEFLASVYDTSNGFSVNENDRVIPGISLSEGTRTAVVRIFTFDNDEKKVEAIRPLEDVQNTTENQGHLNLDIDTSGIRGISNVSNFEYVYPYRGTSNITQKSAYLLLSPDNSKFMHGGFDTQRHTQNRSGSLYIDYYTPAGTTEYGSISFGNKENITRYYHQASGERRAFIGQLGLSADGANQVVYDVAGSSDITFEYSRMTQYTYMGYGSSVAKNFIAYSAPSSIKSSALPGCTYPGGRVVTSGSPTPIGSSNVASSNINGDNPTEGNLIFVVPNNHLNNNSVPNTFNLSTDDQFKHHIDSDDYIAFDIGGEIPNTNGEDVFSQYGRSVDVSRDSPTLAQASENNPTFVAFTAVWKPTYNAYDPDQKDGATVATSFDRSTSITKIVGVWRDSSGVIQRIGIGAQDPSDTSSTKTASTTQELLKYWGAFNGADLNADEEPLVDYSSMFAGKCPLSMYGRKVKLSPSAHIAVITNTRENSSNKGINSDFPKYAEVKVLSRKNITINYNGDVKNWFEYKHCQTINIPTDHTITSIGQYDFGYDIALGGDAEPFLAISSPTEKTVFLYKWSTANDEFEYWNEIHLAECELFGKAVVFDTRESGDPTKICISADESFYVLDIPDKI